MNSRNFCETNSGILKDKIMETKFFTIDRLASIRRLPKNRLHTGRAVVAYECDGTGVRVGVAFCSPSDQFDWEDGKRRALERLRNSPQSVTGIKIRTGSEEGWASELALESPHRPNWVYNT